MVDFSKLKNKSSNFDKLNKALDKINKGPNGADARFWQPEVDKAGNGFAVIRFLEAPAVDGDDAVAFVQVFNHGFQGPGGWFIEECLTTVGEKCPVCEHNSGLWNSGIEANKTIVRAQKRKLHYISNILVVKDPNHPENDGKVFLFKYGAKIFDKLKERFPKKLPDGTYETRDSVDEDFLKFNPFNLWEGANFKLKARFVDNFRNYDKSEFEAPRPISDDDSEIEKIWKSEYSLKDFHKVENFKTYEAQKTRLEAVLGGNSKPRTKSAESDESDGEAAFSSPPFDGGKTVATTESSGDDSTLDYFRNLADSDE